MFNQNIIKVCTGKECYMCCKFLKTQNKGVDTVYLKFLHYSNMSLKAFWLVHRSICTHLFPTKSQCDWTCGNLPSYSLLVLVNCHWWNGHPEIRNYDTMKKRLRLISEKMENRLFVEILRWQKFTLGSANQSLSDHIKATGTSTFFKSYSGGENDL